jgi:hypothetical protein
MHLVCGLTIYNKEWPEASSRWGETFNLIPVMGCGLSNNLGPVVGCGLFRSYAVCYPT